MADHQQMDLIHWPEVGSLPHAYVPHAPDGLSFERIILCKESFQSTARERFVRRICNVYSNIPVEVATGTPHNRIEIGETDPLRRVTKGKRTLVFAVPNVHNIVRVNQTPNAIFPYRQSFSIYGFCPYNCAYCYLSGSPGTWYSPTVKIYVNLPEILTEIDRKAREFQEDIVFCLGKHEDGLALNPLTGYASVLVPFFANHSNARLLIQTKSASVEGLLSLEHKGKTVLSWTLSPPSIAHRYESGAPSIVRRLDAMRQAAERGYPIRANITPVIPDGDWEQAYLSFVRELVKDVPLRQLTIGGIRIDPRGRLLLERRLGRDNPISRALDPCTVEESKCAFYKPSALDGLLAAVSTVVRRERQCSVKYDLHHARPHLIVDFLE